MKDFINKVIDERKDKLVEINDAIWRFAEISFNEKKSADIIANNLAQEGFIVDHGLAGMETAFVGTYGSEKPVIAILGEYDALTGMSQKKGVTFKEEIIEGGHGHGCGHNILGTGALAAAIAVKEAIKRGDVKGTVRYYGCPAEEGGAGKTFMVKEKVFEDVDLVLTWHPATHNSLMNISTLACLGYKFRFKGKSSHAAASPHLGRSALDAVELMNVGVNFLREHIIQEARIHYAITNAGGHSPNVVQAEAEVYYFVRAPKMPQAKEILKRVLDIAKGAALMSGTEVEAVFDDALSNVVPNDTIAKVLHKNLVEIGTPTFEKDEINFANELSKTLSKSDIENDFMMIHLTAGRDANKIIKSLQDKAMCDVVLPFYSLNYTMPGSTDVGDVSWVVPTGQISTACAAMGTAMHSWQMVSQGATGLAHKGMLYAGKVLALTAIDFMKDPSLIEEAKLELVDRLSGYSYESPIPDGVLPR